MLLIVLNGYLFPQILSTRAQKNVVLSEIKVVVCICLWCAVSQWEATYSGRTQCTQGGNAISIFAGQVMISFSSSVELEDQNRIRKVWGVQNQIPAWEKQNVLLKGVFLNITLVLMNRFDITVILSIFIPCFTQHPCDSFEEEPGYFQFATAITSNKIEEGPIISWGCCEC